MKNKTISPRNSQEIILDTEDTNTLVKGVTKILLEKYKPKAICNLENLSDSKFQKRVA